MTGHSCAMLPHCTRQTIAGICCAELVRHPVETRQTRRAGTIIGGDGPLVQPCVQDMAQDRVRVREAASAIASIALVLGQRHGVRRTCAAADQDVAEIFCHTSGRIFERRVSSPPHQWEARGAQDRWRVAHHSPCKSRCSLLARDAFTKKKNTDFFVLLCLLASFLTFGKVNPGLPQSDIFFGGVPPHPPLIFVSAGPRPSD